MVLYFSTAGTQHINIYVDYNFRMISINGRFLFYCDPLVQSNKYWMGYDVFFGGKRVYIIPKYPTRFALNPMHLYTKGSIRITE